MTKLDIIEFHSFNLKSQLYMLAEDGRLVAIVRISNTDCSLHQMYGFYLLLTFDVKNGCVISLVPITVKYWNKTYAVFIMDN